MKRVIFFVLLFSGVNLSLCDHAEARYYRRGGYGGYGGAQTPQSAEANAMANVIRSQGMYNVATSQAMVNIEKARGSYLANQEKAMQFYYARKRAVEAEHANEREQEKAKIQRYQEYMAQEVANAPRLNSNQLNPNSGQITWPRAASGQARVLRPSPNTAEAYFAARAKQTTTVTDSKKMHDTVAAMRDELRGRIHDMNPSDYMESRKFLDTLSLEVERTHG